MTAPNLTRDYDSARAEFIADAEDNWEAGAFCARRDCDGLDELAKLTAKFEADAMAIIDRLNVATAAERPKFTLAEFVADQVMEWLSPHAAGVYSAALNCELGHGRDPAEQVRAMLAASVADLGGAA